LTTGDTPDEAAEKAQDLMTREGGTFEWADDHKCEFGIDKFGLVLFTRKKERKATCPDINLRGELILATPAHKVLGVYLDQELRFKQQVAHALEKGQTWLDGFKRLSRPSQGISNKYGQQYYLAVAAPKMLYAADVFISPPAAGNGHSKGVIRKLSRIQRGASIHILGALRSTATTVLDAHANLLPFETLIDKVCHDAATRYATAPPTNP
ncbi:hypothetical protein OF83DRAFT_1036746, partial [Amylostereum chailletii]